MASLVNILRGIGLGAALSVTLSHAEAKEDVKSDKNPKQNPIEVLATANSDSIEVDCLIMQNDMVLNRYNAARYDEGSGVAHFDPSTKSIVIRSPKSGNIDDFYQRYGQINGETGFKNMLYCENLDVLSASAHKLQGGEKQTFLNHQQVESFVQNICQKYGVDLQEYQTKDDKKKDKYLKELQKDGKIPYHQTRYDLKAFIEHSNFFLQTAKKSEKDMQVTMEALHKTSEAAVLHELIHKDTDVKLNDIFIDIKVVSPEDKLNLHMANETRSFLGTALSFRKDYVNAVTPEQKKAALKNLREVTPEYAEKIVKSEIDPNASKLSEENLDKDMGALFNSVRKNINASYEAHYLKGGNDNTTSYLAVLSGTSKAEKDKNYEQALKSTLTLSGYDFSKFFNKYDFSPESKAYFAEIDNKITAKKSVIAENTVDEWREVLVNRNQERVKKAQAAEKEKGCETKAFRVKNPNNLLSDAVSINKSNTISWQNANKINVK